MKKLLITGANGFIGKNFIEQYENQYEIVQITRDSKYNILKLDTLLSINNIDTVLHFAAKTFVPESFENPYSFYEFNIQSSLNIAEFCRVKKVKKLIYLNSYTYGNPKYLPIDEKHPVSFHSPYNKSKFLAEELLFDYLENITNIVSLRLFNIYGKNQSNNFLIPTIFNQISSDTITVKDLKPKRDYLYIKDLTSLITSIINDNTIHGIYNVGYGKSYSVKEILEILKEVSNINFNIISENVRRKNEVMDCVSDIRKIEKDLKWIPKYSLKQGLADYLHEVKNV